jgi:hypothetical protein
VGGKTGDAIRGVGGSAVESVGEAVGDEVAKALGGLFGGKKENDREKRARLSLCAASSPSR